MFDVSLSELGVIGVVALLVIGPEKLPKVARTLGALTARLQRYVAQVKEEINREVRFEDLQKLQQEIKQGVAEAKEIVTENVAQFKAEITRESSHASASLNLKGSEGQPIKRIPSKNASAIKKSKPKTIASAKISKNLPQNKIAPVSIKLKSTQSKVVKSKTIKSDQA